MEEKRSALFCFFMTARLALISTMCLALAVAAHAQVVNQPWDGTGNLVASQNDTGGWGNFATTYDDFTFTQSTDTNGISWVGGYFNPPTQGAIAGFTVTYYNSVAGAPGNAIAAGFFPGTCNETLVADSIYSYSVAYNTFTFGPGTYFLSLVPDLAFPPQWGWATSAVGDNGGYQTFFGNTAPTGVNNAFSIEGTTTPEPASMAALGLGVVAMLRRRAKKA